MGGSITRHESRCEHEGICDSSKQRSKTYCWWTSVVCGCVCIRRSQHVSEPHAPTFAGKHDDSIRWSSPGVLANNIGTLLGAIGSIRLGKKGRAPLGRVSVVRSQNGGQHTANSRGHCHNNRMLLGLDQAHCATHPDTCLSVCKRVALRKHALASESSYVSTFYSAGRARSWRCMALCGGRGDDERERVLDARRRKLSATSEFKCGAARTTLYDRVSSRFVPKAQRSYVLSDS